MGSHILSDDLSTTTKRNHKELKVKVATKYFQNVFLRFEGQQTGW